MTPYITVVQIWITDTETIPIPVLGVFASKEDAERNAYAVALQVLTEQAPAYVDRHATAVTSPLPDAAVRSFVAALTTHRPDLVRTSRGKVR